VGEPDIVVGVEADRVRKLEQPGSPGADTIAVAIEDHDRMVLVAVEAIDAVSRVDRDRAGPDLDMFGRVLPIPMDPVAVLALADDLFHRSLPSPITVAFAATIAGRVRGARASATAEANARMQNRRGARVLPSPIGPTMPNDRDILEQLNRDYIAS